MGTCWSSASDNQSLAATTGHLTSSGMYLIDSLAKYHIQLRSIVSNFPFLKNANYNHPVIFICFFKVKAVPNN